MHSPCVTAGVHTDPFGTPKTQRPYTLGPVPSIPATTVLNLALCEVASEVKLTLPSDPTNERTVRLQQCPTTPVKLGSRLRLMPVPMTPVRRRLRLANAPPLVRSNSTLSTPFCSPTPPPVCMLTTSITKRDSRILVNRIGKLENMVLDLQRQVAEHRTATSKRPRKGAAQLLQKRRIGRVRLGPVM